MDLGVHGKAFVITGGSDGLGLATARSLLAEGAHVTICGRDKRRLDDAVTELGHDVHAVSADVTRLDDLITIVEAATARWGRLDGLLNAAGTHTTGRFEDITDEEWIADYELKFLAATRAIRLALPHLRTSCGAVVNVLSTGARTPGRKAMPSAPLRAAGLSMTKALATELGTDGIRVNAILVGVIRSGQIQRPALEAGRDVEEYLHTMAARMRIPLGRIGETHEFGDTAAFLLSPRASYITGTAVHVDGGYCQAI